MATEPLAKLSVGIFYRDLLQPGGMPRETALLAREMDKLLDRLVLYCYVGDSSKEGQTQIDGILVRAFYQPGWRWNRDPFRAAAGIMDVLRKNEDTLSVLVLMGSFIPENAPVARVARQSGIPYVLSVGAAFNPHLFSGLKGLRKRIYEHIFENRVVNEALAIRLYSKAQVPHLLSRGYVGGDRFFLAKEGIDWDTIQREGGLALPPSDTLSNPLTFGFLGRLDVYGKGLDVLFEAWAHYKRSGGDGRLLIAGPASRRDSLLVDRLSKRFDPSAITILPAIYGREKYEFLSSLSYLVLPSRHEGIPRVVRESFAVGCPVIVTDHTNLHDVVEEYHAGAAMGMDPHELARTFAHLEQSEQDRLAHREGARRAADSLSWESAARDLAGALVARMVRED